MAAVSRELQRVKERDVECSQAEEQAWSVDLNVLQIKNAQLFVGRPSLTWAVWKLQSY